MSFRCEKGQNIFGVLLCGSHEDSTMNPLWSFHHLETPHLHFKPFENSILVQKTGISRTDWINPWLPYYKVFQLGSAKSPLDANLVVWKGTLFAKCMYISFFIIIGIHFMQGCTATTKHTVTRKRGTKRLKHTKEFV